MSMTNSKMKILLLNLKVRECIQRVGHETWQLSSKKLFFGDRSLQFITLNGSSV